MSSLITHTYPFFLLHHKESAKYHIEDVLKDRKLLDKVRLLDIAEVVPKVLEK
jgi:hypothetical protein